MPGTDHCGCARLCGVQPCSITPLGSVRNDRPDRTGSDWDRVNSTLNLDLEHLDDVDLGRLRAYSHVIVTVLEPTQPSAAAPAALEDWRGGGVTGVHAAICELMAVRRGGVLEVRGLDAANGAMVLGLGPYVAEMAPRGDVLQPSWTHAAASIHWYDPAADPPNSPSVLDAEAWLAEVRRSPADHGTVELIVRRPGVDEREVLEVGELSTTSGLVGDNWAARGSSSTADGSAKLDAQLNIMNWRCALLVAGTAERVPLAGDQLFVDLDLSDANLPAGTRLRLGSALIEVTPEPHTGCAKFTRRFGLDAHRWVNGRVGKQHHLRGICAKVVEPGTVSRGDRISKA